MFRLIRPYSVWLFWPLMILWTWKLVQPRPLPEAIEDFFAFSALFKFLAAKAAHATAYCVLAILLGMWIPKRRAILIIALALVMLHGVATEIVQTMVPNRDGNIRDVVIDWFGISTGVLLNRRDWRGIWQKPSP